MAYSYKCSISFGLVYIPVTLHAAVKTQDIGFNMLDKKTMSRIKYKKTCEGCGGREVKQEDIVKGFEYEDDKYVVFTDEDFEKLKTKKDKNITIEKFVDIAEVDPIYFDRSYYVNPTGAENAYALLLHAMEEENRAGVAKAVLGNRETLLILRAYGGQMLVNTLFFADEIQQSPAKEVNAKCSESELALAKSIIEGMSGAFKAEEYKNEYRERVKEAIGRKVAGKEIVQAKEGASNAAAKALYPELAHLYKCAKKRCILDGELVAFTGGKPDFYAVQRRSLMADGFKIGIASRQKPVQFVAYDILYVGKERITDKPLLYRKEILSQTVAEGYNLSLSRYIEGRGTDFFRLTNEQNLEGIVAKKKDGSYHIGRRTRDWIKIKVMQDEDLLICGYQSDEEGNVKDLVLGYFDGNGKLKNRGKVYLGVSKEDKKVV